MKIINVSHLIMITWCLVTVLCGDVRAVRMMNFEHVSKVYFFLFTNYPMTGCHEKSWRRGDVMLGTLADTSSLPLIG